MVDSTRANMTDKFTTSALSSMADEAFLTEQPFCAKINLRGKADDAAFRAAIESLSLSLPEKPNTFDSQGQSKLFWLGPDEWLLHADENPAVLTDELSKTLAGSVAAVVDVSDYYTVVSVNTSQWLEVLARSCPLDLEEVLAGSDACAQTKVGNAACLLYADRSTGVSSLALQVRWSYAEYLWTLLVRNASSLNLSQSEFAVTGDNTVIL